MSHFNCYGFDMGGQQRISSNKTIQQSIEDAWNNPHSNSGSLVITEKKPHKCPVCDGFGKREISADAWTAYGSIAPTRSQDRLVDCHACDKGILWG